MELSRYLARIGYRNAVEPTLACLEGMQRAHTLAIPFENLDVQLGRPVTTDPAAAFEKIVNRRRGGWCYEQNGLFGWALSKCGFDVTRVAAAVRRSERGEVASANHLCLLVHSTDTTDTWFVDVGFGGSMIAPIRLEESHYDQHPFRIGLRQTADGFWQFWERIDGGEFNFDFRAEAADEAKLAAKCEFLQSNPDSGFVRSLVVQARLPSTHYTLRGKVLSQATRDGVVSRALESPDDLVSVLRDLFHLDVPGVADLWPRIQRRHTELFGDEPIVDNYEMRLRLNR